MTNLKSIVNNVSDTNIITQIRYQSFRSRWIINDGV